MMKYSNCRNPYDFAYPVNDPELFIGRKREMEDVGYYLNQAELVNHPINIALLGKRSAGKTSFLNIIESKAKQLNYCIIRINLDEGDSVTQLAFFYKLFDCIFTKICEMGAFGGINGNTYDTYTDIINGCNIPEDKTFCPFLFPLQFSKAICNNNMNAQLSDNGFKRDLLTIAKEINSPIVLLFDECNVLAKSQIHLQKLRNIFMELPRYMLVFAGTPDLFPMMDEVFSPIIRQFKKINIGAFENQKETKDCIAVPLHQIGIDNISEIIDIGTYKEVKEIHNLSGGYPYEIQLICHMMFKRVQQGKSEKMILDINVLEEVRRELESAQELTKRPILTKIRNLSKEKLLALSKLCESNAGITLEQLCYMESLTNEEQKWNEESLKNDLEYFVEEGLIKTEEDIIIFSGDDFDKIYTKYYALEHNILIKFFDGTLESLWNMVIIDFINKKSGFKIINNFKIESQFDDFLDKMCNPESNDDIFSINADRYLELYNIFINSNIKNKEHVSFAEIEINLKWVKFNMFYYLESATENDQLERLKNIVFELESRSNTIGGRIEIKSMKVATCSNELLMEKVMSSSNKDFKRNLCEQHYTQAIFLHMEKDKEYREEENFFAKLSLFYIEDNIDGNICNNLGYILLNQNQLGDAIQLFKRGLNVGNSKLSALLNYNLGIAEAKNNNINNSVGYLNNCIALYDEIEDSKISCLLVPEIRNDSLFLEEVITSSLLEIAIKSLKIIEDYHEKLLLSSI